MKRVLSLFVIIAFLTISVNIEIHAEESKIVFNNEYPDIKTPKYTTVMASDDAVSLLEDDVVFTEKMGTFYTQKMKMRYSSYGFEPIVRNSSLMLPADFLLSAIGQIYLESGNSIYSGSVSLTVNSDKMQTANGEVTLSEKAVQEQGKIFVPVIDVCEKGFSLFTYCDERDFVIISKNKKNYFNSPSCFDVNDTADTIYRFMQFERPSGEEIIKIVEEKTNNSHPRMLTDRKNLEETLALIESDGRFARAEQMLMASADKLLSLPLIEKEYVSTDILASARSFMKRVETLSAAYLISSDVKYAKKCFEEMENVCNWQETMKGKGAWNQYGHYLDVSEITYGMSVGYDSIYHYMTETQRNKIAKAVYENSLLRAVDTYAGNYNGAPWHKSASNWSFVCAGSIIGACLVFCGDGYSEYEDVYEFLLSQSMHSIEYPFMGFYPDGIWIEGGDYWNYATVYMCKAVLSPLYFSCGTDFGLTNAEGFSETLESVMMIQSGAGGGFDYSDCSTDRQGGAQGYLIARLLGDDTLSDTWYKSRRSIMTVTDTSWESCYELFWFRPSKNTHSFKSESPKDKYFYGADIGFMRERVDSQNGTFVGIKAGESSYLHHSHLDLGSFIFGDEGQRFAIDLGKDDYNIKGGYWGYYGYTLYRKRPEGHNCIVINPRADISSEYYGGQYADAYATITKDGLSSSKSSAFMAVDLSDAYKYDTTSYERGYYLGDNRKSLLVQDEISLKKDNSDIYWFMHTKANITISEDKKSATLTQGGKTLYVKALCSNNDWHFEVMDAKPLPTSPDRTGQDANEGITKLTLRAKGSGNYKIAVKMMCSDDFTLNEITPISKWQLTEIKKSDIVFNNITNDTLLCTDNYASVSTYIPRNAESVSLLADGREISEATNVNAGTSMFLIKPNSVGEGKKELKIKVTYENGEIEYSDSVYPAFIKYDKQLTKDRTHLDFEGCDFQMTDAKEIVAAASSWWQLTPNTSAVGITEGNGGGKALMIKTSGPMKSAMPYARIIHGRISGSGYMYTLSDYYIDIYFDLYSSTQFTNLHMAARQSDGKTLFAAFPMTPEGKMGTSDISYNKNTWYSMHLSIDLAGKNYILRCGDDIIAHGTANGTDFQYIDFTYGSCYNGETYMALDNIQVKYRAKTKNKSYICTYFSDNKAHIDSYGTSADEVSVYLAKYSADGSELLNVDKIPQPIPSGYSNISFDTPYDGCIYKIMVCKKDTIIPVCRASCSS